MSCFYQCGVMTAVRLGYRCSEERFIVYSAGKNTRNMIDYSENFNKSRVGLKKSGGAKKFFAKRLWEINNVVTLQPDIPLELNKGCGQYVINACNV